MQSNVDTRRIARAALRGACGIAALLAAVELGWASEVQGPAMDEPVVSGTVTESGGKQVRPLDRIALTEQDHAPDAPSSVWAQGTNPNPDAPPSDTRVSPTTRYIIVTTLVCAAFILFVSGMLH